VGDARHIDDPAPAPPAEPDEPLIYEALLPAVPASVPRIRQELVGMLRQLDVASERLGDIALVLSEAVTNVVLHGYAHDRPGPLYASAGLTGRTLRISVVDFGRGLGSPSPSPGGGFGLSLIGELSDDLQICSNEPDEGTSLHVVFERLRPAGAIGHPGIGGSERRKVLHEYVRALRTVHASLQAESDAVMAQAGQALAHAQRCRRNRRRARR
jgi:anti-sigma regulatory factor (Ser/Thr protein kinase)